MAALVIGMVVAAAVGYLVGLIALRRTGIYFAMITVAIAEVFFFVEFNPLSDYTGGENGLPGVPTPALYLGFTTIHFDTDWSLYAFLAFWYLRRHGDRAAHRALARRRRAARDPRQSAARRRGRPQHPRLQADRLRRRRRLCRLRRRPARRDAGLHAAGRVHVRHLGAAGDADRDRRRRHAVRPAGRRRRLALSQRFLADHAASRRHLEAGARRRLRAAGLLPAPRHHRRPRRPLAPGRPAPGKQHEAAESDPTRSLPTSIAADSEPRRCSVTPSRAPADDRLGRPDPEGRGPDQALRRPRRQRATSISPSGAANCAASSARTAPARPRSSRC